MRNQEEKGFNNLISNCVEKALQSLGEDVATSFFYQIEKKFQFTKEEFASKPLEFTKYLREFLGTSGADIIERLIVQQIRSAFDLSVSPSTKTLEGAVAEAKKSFLAE